MELDAQDSQKTRAHRGTRNVDVLCGHGPQLGLPTMPPKTAIPLEEFRAANWPTFEQFEGEFDRRLASYSRNLPPGFYKSIRRGLTKAFGESARALPAAGPGFTFRFKVVIDTNIIVQDSLAVAGGKQSTTERIFASQFVTLLAPPDIREESERIIRARAKRKRVPVEVALTHARMLLTRVTVVQPSETPFLETARSAIGSHSPEDVSFLAVAIESGAVGIVSRDRAAFDRQTLVRRWDLRDLVGSVVTYETGALSAVVVGKGAKALLSALQSIVVAIAGALVELINIALRALEALVAGTIDALSRVPAWGWLAAAAVLVGVAIYASQHPEVRERVAQGVTALVNGVRTVGAALVQACLAFVSAVHDLLVWLWNLLLPVTATGVVVAGVFIKRMLALMREAQRIQSTVPGA